MDDFVILSVYNCIKVNFPNLAVETDFFIYKKFRDKKGIYVSNKYTCNRMVRIP